jgi:Ulp1 family protease
MIGHVIHQQPQPGTLDVTKCNKHADRASLFDAFRAKTTASDAAAADAAAADAAAGGGGICNTERSLMVAVSDQDEGKLWATLSRHEDHVIFEGFNTTIIVMHLICVRRGEWLNSETINVYVQMIEVEAKKAGHNVTMFNSFFVTKIETEGHKGVKTWTRKLKREGKTLFDLDRFFFPVNLYDTHWVGGVVDFKAKKISILDSMAGNSHSLLRDQLLKYLVCEAEAAKVSFQKADWSSQVVKAPQQENW